MDSGFPLGKTLRRWAAGLLHAEDPARKASSDVPILPAPEELDLLLEDVVSTTGVPGAALSVVVDGETVSAAAGVRSVDGYFPLDESALFEPLGLTKLAVGGVVHELAGAGTLDLDDPVVRWLPELGGTGDGISVAHLLSHTSGYVGENPANLDKVFRYPWDEFAARSCAGRRVPAFWTSRARCSSGGSRWNLRTTTQGRRANPFRGTCRSRGRSRRSSRSAPAASGLRRCSRRP